MSSSGIVVHLPSRSVEPDRVSSLLFFSILLSSLLALRVKNVRRKFIRKYKVHLPEAKGESSQEQSEQKTDNGSEEEDRGLLDAVKGVGEALHLSGSGTVGGK